VALIGSTTAEKLYNKYVAAGMTPAGAAGSLGNQDKESGLKPTNLQNGFENKPPKTGGVGYTDATYTAAVDSGAYTGFVDDRAGYGIAQWTHPSRKAALLTYAKSLRKSIGDLEMQSDFYIKELKESYPAVWKVLTTTTSVREASNAVMLDFERPADQSIENQNLRASVSQTYYDKYAKKGSGTMGFTNSQLATVRLISPNKTVNRNHAIDTITIHCFVGQVTAKRGCEVFQPSSKRASCNYVVGYDGSIGLCVEEKDRSWCTGGTMKVNGISGSSNDYQAVTIEVASDKAHPYAITEKAMAALIELCADICRRNGIKALLWKGDKKLVGQPAKQNMTVHRWFANKACPGDYIYERLPEIAAKVNARLGVSPSDITNTAPMSAVPYKVRITVTDLNIRKGPGTNNARVSTIEPGVYTIVSEATGQGATLWGKLKSGAGWVSLDYCKKL